MHFTKKVTMIGSIIMLACCFTGCEKEVITVAGIQNPEVREDQYIVVENFELKQIEDNGLTGLLGDYIDGIDYYPESAFGDEAHFTQEYLDSERENIIEKLFNTIK